MHDKIEMLDTNLKSDTILSWILEEMKDNKLDAVNVVCKNGKCIQVSSLLLAVISPYLASVLNSTELQDFAIVIPELEIDSLCSLLDDFLYPSGKFPGKGILKDLCEIFWIRDNTSKKLSLKEDSDKNILDAGDLLKGNVDAGDILDLLQNGLVEVKHEVDVDDTDNLINGTTFVSIQSDEVEKTATVKKEVGSGRGRKRQKKDPSESANSYRPSKSIKKETDQEEATTTTSRRKRAATNYKEDAEVIEDDDFLTTLKSTKDEDPDFETQDDPIDDDNMLQDDIPRDDEADWNSDEENTKSRKKRKSTGKVAYPILEENMPKDPNFAVAQEKMKAYIADESDYCEPTKLWFKLHNLSLDDKLAFFKDKLICPLCNLKFMSESRGRIFFNHIRRHKLDNWKCPCKPKGGRPNVLREHVQLEHWDWKKCDHCEKILDPEKMQIHMRYQHSEKAESIVCTECGEQFKLANSYRYKIHMAYHKAEKFECECPILFTNKKQKVHHMQVIHLKEMFGCDQCLFFHPEEKMLTQHIQKTHDLKVLGESARPTLICDICGYVCKSNVPRMLVEHKMRVHDPVLQQCPHCPVRLPKLPMKDHIRMTHRSGGVCNKCGLQVKRLNVHMRTVHTPSRLSRLKCEVCGKGFHLAKALKSHMMSVHLKLRPYKCRYGCEFAYNDTSNRNQHEKKKHGALFSAKILETVKDE